jgi:hypothetical protein
VDPNRPILAADVEAAVVVSTHHTHRCLWVVVRLVSDRVVVGNIVPVVLCGADGVVLNFPWK